MYFISLCCILYLVTPVFIVFISLFFAVSCFYWFLPVVAYFLLCFVVYYFKLRFHEILFLGIIWDLHLGFISLNRFSGCFWGRDGETNLLFKSKLWLGFFMLKYWLIREVLSDLPISMFLLLTFFYSPYYYLRLCYLFILLCAYLFSPLRWTYLSLFGHTHF